MSAAGQHHVHKKSDKATPERRLLELLVLFVAVVEPLMTIPQIYAIWYPEALPACHY